MNGKTRVFLILMTGAISAGLINIDIRDNSAHHLCAKQKPDAVDPDDPTLRLFQLLDSSHRGKLEDFYVFADIYPDPKNPGQEFQRVLRIDYDKNRTFGKLKLSVRSVAKLQPEQVKTYSAKMVYEFGVDDAERFMKSEPGPLGRMGDVYLRSTEDRPVATAPITDEARKSYQRLVSVYVIPALQKSAKPSEQ